MARAPPLFDISPPLLNSASPWATTLDDLRHLYACPLTGAVTTRTSLLHGFDHDPDKHQYAFFNPSGSDLAPNASVNSLGYSPLPLETYLAFIQTISDEQAAPSRKGFIVSVTGSPEEITRCYALVAAAAQNVRFPLAMEINLSCPNIPGRPPPAYSQAALTLYLDHLRRAITERADVPQIPVGLKTPPYTHTTEYDALLAALKHAADADPQMGCPVSFLTATNTLGSCLVFAEQEHHYLPPSPPPPPLAAANDPHPQPGSQPQPERRGLTSVLPTPTDPAADSPDPRQGLGLGLGGLAGAPLHPLALGNVATLRRMLDTAGAGLERVRIIGVGGVLDGAGYRRMRAAGADAVGLATGLGLRGVEVFGEIGAGLGERW